MSKVKVTILGSGSGMPVAHRTQAAILLETNKEKFLFDTGEGCAGALLRHKVDYNKIKAIFISHTHPDHCTGLPLLIQMMYLAGRKEELEIYVPEEALYPLRILLSMTYLFPEKLSFKISLLKINSNFEYQGAGCSIRAYPNSHLRAYEGRIPKGVSNQMQSYSFSIQAGEKKIVYSSDLGSIVDLNSMASDAYLLIVEGLHLNLEELFSKLSWWKVQKTILTHFMPELEEKEKSLVAMAEKYGVRNFKLAKDGMRVK